VSEYIKLRAQYKKHKVCKQPNLNVSIAIASRMGKGSYFAHQIRHNIIHLMQHHHLSPPSTYTQNRYETLLNNEHILHNVCVYLAAQSLGTVSPRALCYHFNDIILPALRINGKIIKSIAQCWLKFRLGYECKEAKKGMYMDRHEHSDVLKERSEFINKLFNKYKWWVGRVHYPMHRSDPDCYTIGWWWVTLIRRSSAYHQHLHLGRRNTS